MSTIARPGTTASPQTNSASGRKPLWGMMAEFDNVDDITKAARTTRDAGYRWWDTHTPFPVHGLDKAMGIKPTWLPIFVFFAGLTGLTLGFLLQWFTNASDFDFWALVPVHGYPFLISGKPMMSGPAWVPVMFELTILLAATTTVGLMLLFNGLPMLYHPTLKHPKFARATNDRFFLVIESKDPKFRESEVMELMQGLRPLSIERIEP